MEAFSFATPQTCIATDEAAASLYAEAVRTYIRTGV